MTGVLVRAGALAAVYLLVLTSVKWGDVLIAVVLGLAVTLALRPSEPALSQAGPLSRLWAAAVVAGETAKEMAVGSVRVARFCLRAGRGDHPGMVEVPRDGRSRRAVALWGVLTGEAPDEIPVDVDEERGVLIVHLIDARDPDAVRARHRRNREDWQRKVIE
jgi:multisubunit Na+/H+ antiporter MnhE subunit